MALTEGPHKSIVPSACASQNVNTRERASALPLNPDAIDFTDIAKEEVFHENLYNIFFSFPRFIFFSTFFFKTKLESSPMVYVCASSSASLKRFGGMCEVHVRLRLVSELLGSGPAKPKEEPTYIDGHQ